MSDQTSKASSPSLPCSWTQGIAHVGLTVRDLNQSVDFFVSALGYQVLGEKPGYPAAFVSDGHLMITLWQAQATNASMQSFDRHRNLGLHHLALSVASERLDSLYERLKSWPQCEIEFAPELAGKGPSRHMMVAIAGSGIRVEFRSNA